MSDEPAGPPDHEEVETINPHIAAVVLGGASLFELIASSIMCGESDCSGLTAYAVTAGVVSLAALAPIALFLFAEPLAPAAVSDGLPHLSLFLCAWWLPACFLLTFIGPFAGLCNGYFATIAATASAVQLCRVHVPVVDTAFREVQNLARDAPAERPVLMLLALSATAMWVEAAISLGRAPHEHGAVKAWAIIVGVVSMIMCAFYLLLNNLALHRGGFAALLALWWCQGIAITFIPSSYMGTCNGYVSTWASVFLALYFAHATHSPHDLVAIPAAPPDDEGPGLGGPTTTYHAAEDSSEGFSDGLKPGGPYHYPGSAPALHLGPAPTEGFRHTPDTSL